MCGIPHEYLDFIAVFGQDSLTNSICRTGLKYGATAALSALFSRFSSRSRDQFAGKLMMAMRFEFGGHLEKAREKAGGG
jgi:6-phosphogluconate dehydrogenase (decarboxylating)